jgi:hypothetical protein
MVLDQKSADLLGNLPWMLSVSLVIPSEVDLLGRCNGNRFKDVD